MTALGDAAAALADSMNVVLPAQQHGTEDGMQGPLPVNRALREAFCG